MAPSQSVIVDLILGSIFFLFSLGADLRVILTDTDRCNGQDSNEGRGDFDEQNSFQFINKGKRPSVIAFINLGCTMKSS